MSREHDLIERLAAVAFAFTAPDREHLALRSPYSRLGVCTIAQGRHTDACLAWREALADAVAYLDETDDVSQLTLLAAAERPAVGRRGR